MKKQIDIAKKQYQVLGKVYQFDKKADFQILTDKVKKLTDKNLKYSNLNFNKYQKEKNFKTHSFFSKFDCLKTFHGDLEKLKNIKSRSENVEQKKLLHDNASYIYDRLLNDYELQYAK